MIKKAIFVACLFGALSFNDVSLAQTRVAAVGDSITAGWKLKEAEKYVTKLAGLLGSGYEVRNFGHSAYSMLKIGDMSYWNSPMFQAAQDFGPDVVTIMLGTNDAHPDYWPEHEDEYHLDYLDMIATFQALPSNPTVIVLGLPYLKPGGRYDGVVALDARLPLIAAEAGVQFVEIWEVLIDSGLSENELMKDPIHPSAAAHTIMAETIYNVAVDPLVPDSDGDGVADHADVFPNAPSEWADSDEDGVGDNADAFPRDPEETKDGDGDGVGDNGDAFPEDPQETKDSDGDGVGDNQEEALDTDPLDADTDNDGLDDGFELDEGLNPTDSSDCPEWICGVTQRGWRLGL